MGTKEKAPSVSASVCLWAVLACSCLLLAAISLSRQQPHQNLWALHTPFFGKILSVVWLFLPPSGSKSTFLFLWDLQSDSFNLIFFFSVILPKKQVKYPSTTRVSQLTTLIAKKTSPKSPAALDLEGKRLWTRFCVLFFS